MSATPDTMFEHVFISGEPDKVTLLLLHGTGGDEHDLVPLGTTLLPGATVLSPRGQILEHGKPRFFRRHAEGVLDVPDLQMRADGLAAWVREQVAARHAPSRVVAVGFSNGANIAAAVMLRAPDLLHGAVLFRAMVPYEPDMLPTLTGVRVLLSAGMHDPLIPPALTERLATILRDAGAAATLEWHQAAHGLVPGDIRVATEFLAQFGAP